MIMPLAGRRIGLLTPLASRLGGGVFEAIVTQAAMLRGLGAVPVVIAVADPFNAADQSRLLPGEILIAPPHGPGVLCYSRRLLPLLLEAELDCLHLHGIWLYPSRAATRWAAITGRPYLISPHGMLDPWIAARGRWKKALARAGYERASWRAATRLHALTQTEADSIRCATGRADSLIVPNAAPPAAASPGQGRAPEVLYLGRIHPKKNLPAVLAAWQQLATAHALPPTARLTIAGWGDPEHVAAFKADLAHAPPSAHFIGPCFDGAKQAALTHARFTILPSFSEGLPIAVLESWASGTPALISQACNLPEGLSAGAALDCGMTADQIAPVLLRALAMSEAEWLTMAHASCQLADSTFGAATVSARWAAAYAEVLEDKP